MTTIVAICLYNILLYAVVSGIVRIYLFLWVSCSRFERFVFSFSPFGFYHQGRVVRSEYVVAERNLRFFQ